MSTVQIYSKNVDIEADGKDGLTGRDRAIINMLLTLVAELAGLDKLYHVANFHAH